MLRWRGEVEYGRSKKKGGGKKCVGLLFGKIFYLFSILYPIYIVGSIQWVVFKNTGGKALTSSCVETLSPRTSSTSSAEGPSGCSAEHRRPRP